uniref:Uncharacterized protein n=1 Tax=Oryza glumipatula TaxID=40148 RepID=A0A0D9ZIT6_9ORYZ
MPPSCTGFLLCGLQGLPGNGLCDSFLRTSNGAKLRRHISLMIMQYPIRIEVAAESGDSTISVVLFPKNNLGGRVVSSHMSSKSGCLKQCDDPVPKG